MKIEIDITEDEISSLESCIQTSESEGNVEDEARETIHKIKEAFQQGVHGTGGESVESVNFGDHIGCPVCGTLLIPPARNASR